TDLALARLPPLMLDWLGPDYITREQLSLRGYDLPCYPYKKINFCEYKPLAALQYLHRKLPARARSSRQNRHHRTSTREKSLEIVETEVSC
ncbi:MAG: hypothetical protein ACYSYV_02010, partial [Planctomycetota bacterium]